MQKRTHQDRVAARKLVEEIFNVSFNPQKKRKTKARYTRGKHKVRPRLRNKR